MDQHQIGTATMNTGGSKYKIPKKMENIFNSVAGAGSDFLNVDLFAVGIESQKKRIKLDPDNSSKQDQSRTLQNTQHIAMLESKLKSAHDAKRTLDEKLTETEAKLEAYIEVNANLSKVALEKQSTIDMLHKENEQLRRDAKLEMEWRQLIEKDSIQLRTQMDTLNEDLSKVKMELEKSRKKNLKLTLSHLNLMDQLEDAQDNLGGLESEESDIVFIKEVNKQELHQSLDTQLQQLQCHLVTMESESAHSKKEYFELNEQHYQTQKKIGEVEKALTKAMTELDEQRDKEIKLTTSNLKLSNELEQVQSKLCASQSDNLHLGKEVKKIENELGNSRCQVQEMKDALARMDFEYDRSKKEYYMLDRQFEDIKKKLREGEEALQRKENELQDIINEELRRALSATVDELRSKRKDNSL